MENFHSTKELLVDRHPSYGTRISVKGAKNCTSKNGRFATTVGKSVDMTDGDAYRAFFAALDAGTLKNQQGAVLHCSKKDGYWFDVSSAFPKGITSHTGPHTKDATYFNFRTIRYSNGTKQLKYVYNAIGFSNEIFRNATDGLTVMPLVEKARFIKDNLSSIATKDGYAVVEYLTDQFEKVPWTKLPISKKMPRDIIVNSVDSTARTARATLKLKAGQGDSFSFIFDISKAPEFLHKSVYAFYIANMIERGITLDGKRITFDEKTGCIEVREAEKPVIPATRTPVVIEPVKQPVAPPKPKTIADPNSAEAQALIGKRVFADFSYVMSDKKVLGVLGAVDSSEACPFFVGDLNYPFIMEAPEPEVTCYDFSDPEVRGQLFGRKFRNEEHTFEEMVYSFKRVDDRWMLNGTFTSFRFMNECRWLVDGTKCGVVKEA